MTTPELKLIGMGLMVMMVTLLSAGIGAMPIPPEAVAGILLESMGLESPWTFTPVEQTVLLVVRLPRLVLAVSVGATLAASGAAMQGLFRNPLADPALIGVSAGAALGAVSTVVLGWQAFGTATLPLAAFIGGLGATVLVWYFAGATGQRETAALLLAGVAVNALAGSVTGLLTHLADDQQLRTLIFWSLGSLSGATWERLLAGLPCLAVTVVLLTGLGLGSERTSAGRS